MMTELTTPQPWLITTEAFIRLRDITFAQTPPTAPPGKGVAAPSAPTLEGGVYTIPIHGTITRRISPVVRERLAYYGEPVALVPEVMAALHEARNNPAVHAVLLDIDSPGGTVNGTPELAAAVRELAQSKYTYAYTSGLACSAAYWVASQCDAIYTAPSARLGSIGVILPILDVSALFEKNGLRMEVIAAGKYKGTGIIGTSLTDEQRTLLQQQVNDTWQAFRAAATSRRRIVAADMEGQTFAGTLACERGLADASVNSLAEVQQKLQRRHGNPTI